jgi:type IV pilus assembly protein PilB
MIVDEKKLEKMVRNVGILTDADLVTLTELRKTKPQTLSDFLLSNNKVKEGELKKLEAYVLGIPFINLEKEKIDPSILSLIPEPIAKTYNIVAFKKKGADLEVVMLDIDNLSAIDFVRKKTGLRILPRLTDSESIKSLLVQYKKSLQAEFNTIIQKETANIERVEETDADISEKDLKNLAEDLPIIKIVESLISHAIIQDASDIHVEPQDASLIVRYRIDGLLHDAMELPKEAAAGIIARIKVLSNLKLDEKRLPQDGRFKIIQDGAPVSFRVSTLPTYFGEKTVIRILKESSYGYTLEGLGFHGEALERIEEGIHQHTGIMLCSGPTGSGKTTSLYTLLDILNTPEVNISTIEDPIEYQMPRINQTQVKPDIGMSFANGLRALLRQDPNIIMVGEIRDGETAGLAVNAALTGHLVLSTIHTNSASGVLPRLLDMEIEPFLIVSTVKTVIGQRLVRRLTDTKEQYFLTEAEIATLGKKIDLEKVRKALIDEKIIAPDAIWAKIPLYKPLPNKESADGYHGRIGIHEVLRVTSTIKELILQGKGGDAIEEQAKKEGMLTMLEDGIFQCVQGKTSIEEILRVVNE